VVDRLTEQRHLIPCTTTITAEELGVLFCNRVFRYHGLPETTVSDRGPQFAARFWKHLCSCQKIDARLSTAFHPQTDRQTERVNAVVEQHLRAYVAYLQDIWADYLFRQSLQVTSKYQTPRPCPRSSPITGSTCSTTSS